MAAKLFLQIAQAKAVVMGEWGLWVCPKPFVSGRSRWTTIRVTYMEGIRASHSGWATTRPWLPKLCSIYRSWEGFGGILEQAFSRLSITCQTARKQNKPRWQFSLLDRQARPHVALQTFSDLRTTFWLLHDLVKMLMQAPVSCLTGQIHRPSPLFSRIPRRRKAP